MFRLRMRPLSATLALAYTLSFIVACLSTCLGTDVAEHHRCCPQEQGLRSSQSSEDCCKVVPGVSGHAVASAGTAVESRLVTHEAIAARSLTIPAAPLAPAAGPPLILRI
jgi:hypothetical protein